MKSKSFTASLILNWQQKGRRSQSIQAARGEITDRYGRPLVQNKVGGYNITLDRAYLVRGEENEIILRLLDLLTAAGEFVDRQASDYRHRAFCVSGGGRNRGFKLKSFLNVGSYTSVEDVMSWLVERYQLEGLYPFAAAPLGGDPMIRNGGGRGFPSQALTRWQRM